MTRSIPWPRILAEGFAIVVSILLAFGIQAWWEGRQERAEAVVRARSLRAEFSQIREQITDDIQEVEAAEAATRTILEHMEPNSPALGTDSLADLLNSSFSVNVLRPEGGAFLALLGSGEIANLQDDTLSDLLAEWPIMSDDIQRLNGLLAASREEEIRGRLMSLGVPERTIARFLNLGPGQHAFDPSRVLTDVALESALVARLVRFRNLRIALDNAINHHDLIDARLELVAEGSTR